MNIETKKFDWQNLIIVDGCIYAKTTKEIDSPSSSENNVCMLCEMFNACHIGHSCPCYHVGANNSEYMTEVGRLLIKNHTGEIRMKIFEEYEPM